MLVRPKRWKQHKLSALRLDTDLLMPELGCTARRGHVIEVPDGHQLPIREVVTTTVDMPVIILASSVALQVVADVFEGALEERELLAELADGNTQ